MLANSARRPLYPAQTVYLGDDLFSRQPICQAVLDTGGHFLFVCKPDSHPAIEEYRTGISLDEQPTSSNAARNG